MLHEDISRRINLSRDDIRNLMLKSRRGEEGPHKLTKKLQKFLEGETDHNYRQSILELLVDVFDYGHHVAKRAIFERNKARKAEREVLTE